jgi:hypothetical protein
MGDMDQLVTRHFIVEATLPHPNNGISELFFSQIIVSWHGNIFFPWNVIECCGKEFSFQNMHKVFKVEISINNMCWCHFSRPIHRKPIFTDVSSIFSAFEIWPLTADGRLILTVLCLIFI